MSLDISELRNFSKQKYRYKKLVMSDMFELVPGADKQAVGDAAQYVSIMLANEAKRKWVKKTTEEQSSKRRRTRSSLSADITDKNKNNNALSSVTQTGAKSTWLKCVDLTETFINDLEETLTSDTDKTIHIPDTEETSFSASEMDDTYEDGANVDGSVTKQKTLAQSCNANKDTNSDRHQGNADGVIENTLAATDNDEIQCIGSCLLNCASESIRCNLCMVWFHTECVGISDLDSIGAWGCADCRMLPRTVQVLETKMETFLKSTEKIFENINSLAVTFENKFQNLNDRITGLSNQHKQSEQSSTSSLSDLRQEVESLKTDINKKSNLLLSKTQSLCDKVKSTPDLVKQISPTCSNKTVVNDNVDVRNSSSRQSDSQGSNENIQHSVQPDNQSTERNTTSSNSNPKVVKRNLTLITGSDAVTCLEPKFLGKMYALKVLKMLLSRT